MSESSLKQPLSVQIRDSIVEHGLPDEYYDSAERYLYPLAESLYVDSQKPGNPDQTTYYVGIQGSQGSGKSTCADFLKLILEVEFGLSVLVASIDDFYLTLQQRKALVSKVHPLLLTRGVPGTHDITMLHTMFDNANQQKPFIVPVFDKSIDDRAPQEQWQCIETPVDVVILEGWCVGIKDQSDDELSLSINELERVEDPDMVWRQHVNQALRNDYSPLYARLNRLIALQVPSFDCVFFLAVFTRTENDYAPGKARH